MTFNGFRKEGIEFLKTLHYNNNKKWFEENRHLWETYILEPNKAFVEEMGETLQILVPTIKAIPKSSASLFRIYRDIRFSKDKTPIKEKIGIIFWQGSAHRMSSSTFYFFYNANSYHIASGIRNFKPPILKAFRKYIQNEENAKQLDEILKDLEAKGFTISPKKYKRIPKEFSKNHPYSHLTLYGTLNAHKTYQIDEKFYSFDIIDFAFKHFEELKDLQSWLYNMCLTLKE